VPCATHREVTVPSAAPVDQLPDRADGPDGIAAERSETVPDGTLPAALPVALEVRGALLERLRRVVEGTLGWQPVDEVTAGLVPPAVRLTDVSGTGGDGTPTVLLVAPDDPPRVAADAAARQRPSAIVSWPGSEADLIRAVARATAAPRGVVRGTSTLRLGGAAGGVGTTTVVLAVAGAAAWRGRAVLVASDDPVLLPDGAPAIDPAAMAAPDLWTRAAPLEGVPDARAVRLVGPPADVDVVDPSVDAVLLDHGVGTDVDVLVVRPDAAGLAALARTTAAVVVVVGRGPASARAVSDAVGSRRRIDLPWSARVGRAGVVGRVPAALPGTFVRAVLPLAPRPAAD
jgi:hypothetical protein